MKKHGYEKRMGRISSIEDSTSGLSGPYCSADEGSTDTLPMSSENTNVLQWGMTEMIIIRSMIRGGAGCPQRRHCGMR